MINTLFLTLELSKIILYLSFSTPKHTYKASRAILSNFVEELLTQYYPQCLSALSRALFPPTFLEIAVGRCRKTVHGQTGDAESRPSLGCCNCLCVNVYYVSRKALWAGASTSVQGHDYRHRQGGPGVLRQETPQIDI